VKLWPLRFGRGTAGSVAAKKASEQEQAFGEQIENYYARSVPTHNLKSVAPLTDLTAR
jgi:hypothetical protein